LLNSLREKSETYSIHTTRFNATAQWVLADHKIFGGLSVLPGTAYLEMARAALTQKDGSAVQFRDVLFVTPLIVRDSETREVETRLEKNADGFRFQISSKSESPNGLPWQEHAHGHIALRAPGPVERFEIATEISTRQLVEVELTTAQRIRIREKGFGPHWNNLQRLYVGPDSALALLELPAEFQTELNSLALHPALLDVAVGFALLTRGAGEYLPLSYKKLTSRGPLPARVYSLVSYRHEPGQQDSTITYDLSVMDEAGVEVIRIEEFTAKRVTETARESHAARAAVDTAPAQASAERAGSEYLVLLRSEAIKEGMTTSEALAALDLILAGRLPPQLIVSPKDFNASLAQAQAATPAQLLEAIKSIGPAALRTKHPRPDLRTEFVAAADDIEKNLAGLWQDLLGLERIGTDDNFFELGGDSVLAIQIIARAHQIGLHLTPQQLFQHPTIRQLTRIVSSEPAPEAVLPEVRVSASAATPTAADFPLAGLNAKQFAVLADLISDIDNA
jgi:aryl carrier-like protein